MYIKLYYYFLSIIPILFFIDNSNFIFLQIIPIFIDDSNAIFIDDSFRIINILMIQKVDSEYHNCMSRTSQNNI